jgi:hypothetical protein
MGGHDPPPRRHPRAHLDAACPFIDEDDLAESLLQELAAMTTRWIWLVPS